MKNVLNHPFMALNLGFWILLENPELDYISAHVYFWSFTALFSLLVLGTLEFCKRPFNNLPANLIVSHSVNNYILRSVGDIISLILLPGWT